MGRHSAPDDDTVEPAVAAARATATIDLDKRYGRHARPDDAVAADPDERHTQTIAVVDADVAPDDLHDTGVIAPVEPGLLPLEEAPGKPSRADRRAAKKAAKADATAAKATAKAAAKADAATAEPVVAEPVVATVDLTKEATTPKKTKKRRTKKDGSETNTQADLRVLRENSAVRARCIAAVLVSFLLYTVVMVVISRADVYLLWLWIPIVVSGFGIGFFLDLAHKSAAKAKPPA